jgi:programmed cell death 6-interacting protein
LILSFSGSEMPQSLKEKAAAVVSAGGGEELYKMIGELPDLLQRNKEILDEADRLLREERESDDQVNKVNFRSC